MYLNFNAIDGSVQLLWLIETIVVFEFVIFKASSILSFGLIETIVVFEFQHCLSLYEMPLD